MPHKIIAAEWLAPAVKRLVVEAPHVVRHCEPGQFVIVRPTGDSERIPLTVAHVDRAGGSITLIIQAVGATSTKLCNFEAGQTMSDVAGPLGKPTEIEAVGHAVIVGGGVGTAVIYPQAPALKKLGNRVTAIIGGRSKQYVILENELRGICDEVLPCTDDGSYGFKGFVTQRLKQLIDETQNTDRKIGVVICAGPVPMMRAVAETTRPLAIHTIASLNPIMVDGTGMCGGCRVQVEGKSLFACVDGPEFDAHKVDFAELSDRLTAYREMEKVAMERHTCKLSQC
ncbi:MAG: sulfide/dihydroorotate dehydrogenase-like FAD/NAD-binding protein [Tepidisphaerales bacterium]